MKVSWRLAVSGMVVCLLLPSIASGTPEWMNRPGTIGHALSLPDGSRVCLDAVVVDKIRARQSPSYFVIRECFDSKARLVVYAIPSPLLRFGQTVDVYGTIDTLPNGSRAVINASVFGYTDSEGNLLYHGPLIKGLLAPTAWEWKSALTTYSPQGMVTTLDLPTPPGEPNPAPGGPPVYCATIAGAKALSDGTAVELQCKPIDSVSSGYFIMAEDDTSDTLTVYYTTDVDETDRVNKVTGTMATEASERVLNVDSGPGFDPQGFVGTVRTVAQGTIAWVKTCPDYSWLLEMEATLESKVVSRVAGGASYFYIQEPGCPSGIRVYDDTISSSLQPGEVVSVYDGEMGTVDGERMVYSYWSELGEPVDPPTPVGMPNHSLGGGSFNVLTPGPEGASGINNVGLLTRTWGEVTSVGPGYIYIDDGSECTDGTGATGVRVVGLTGYLPYIPAVGDYVAVTGISGLGTYATGYARTVRLSDPTDLVALRPTGPPVGFEVHATGSGKIACYWRGVSGATGYNIYRGTTSGGQDYGNPVNGATPWNTPSYPGSDVFAFTDTGLVDGTEYFYTAKAVRAYGESAACDEDSDMPDAGATPWDTRNAAAIVNAILALAGNPAADMVRVVGPDGTIYQRYAGDQVLPPDGELIPGTTVLLYPNGWTTSLPDDGSFPFPAPPLNASDGPYRRVKTEQEYTGVTGSFYPGWVDRISMSGDYPDDTYWTYLGSRWETGPPQKRTAIDIDAGLQWSRVHWAFNPHLSLKYRKEEVPGPLHLWNAAHTSPIRFDNQFGYPIRMWYFLQREGSTKTYTPVLTIEGMNQYAGFSTVVLGACSPVKSGIAMMKRVHSIAQGKPPNTWRRTGSRFYGASFFNGQLRDSQGNWGVTWIAEVTAEQGCYPSTDRVKWTTPPNREYYEETGIECDLR